MTSYEGQPSTCYRCGDTGHMYQGCPKRKNAGNTGVRELGKTWADMVGNVDTTPQREERNRQTVLQPTTEQAAPMNDNISQVHGTETEEGETISDSMRERMDDGSDGMETMAIDGHSLSDMAEEMEAVTGMTDGLEGEKRRENGQERQHDLVKAIPQHREMPQWRVGAIKYEGD